MVLWKNGEGDYGVAVKEMRTPERSGRSTGLEQGEVPERLQT
jgi:hypothetical protein